MPKRTQPKRPRRSRAATTASASPGECAGAAGATAARDLQDEEASARRCVVCGAHGPARGSVPGAFVRFRLLEGVAVVDTRRGGGRGAHVCVQRACLERLSARSLGRALRAPVAPLDTAVMMMELHHRARRYVLDTLGLARRAGVLASGVKKVAAMKAPGTVVIVAADLADRSRRALGRGIEFLHAELLGQAAGLGRVGAVAIRPGPLAERAAYWLGVWYETRRLSPEQRGGDGLMLREPSLPASASSTVPRQFTEVA